MTSSVRFILRFLLIYLCFQLLYTTYLYSFSPSIDPVTRLTSEALLPFFHLSSVEEVENQSKVRFMIDNKAIVNIKEGCNGLSVVWVLIAFMLSFRVKEKSVWKIMGLGVITILGFNIFRIWLLIWIKLTVPQYFTSFHEYVFPVVLYLIAFVFMIYWARTPQQLNNQSNEAQ